YVAAIALSAKEWSNVPSATSEFALLDVASDKLERIDSHGNRLFRVAFDSSGEKMVTGDIDGFIRVGPITGGTPHLLIGHQNHVADVAVDPSGKWIASTELNKPVVRLWPMPEGSPLQTLPHQELLDRLRKLTNIRVVVDKNSSTGYRV